MTTIFERVAAALATIAPAVPYAMKPYLSPTGEPLPAQFVDYQLIEDAPAQHADNSETERAARVQVTIWSQSGLVSLPDVQTAMIAAGFKPAPRRQLPKDPQTAHFGIAQDFTTLE